MPPNLDIMNITNQVPIWLDCDTGHDDAFAILVAATHPESDLLGISTTYGNAPLSNTTYNTRAVLKSIGRDDVPVFPGAAAPFCRPLETAPSIHGTSGLDGTTVMKVPDVPERTDMIAIEAMNQAIRKTTPGTAWIIATGPLTNMALLFSVYPDLVHHIQGLSIMGGAFGQTWTDKNGKQHIGNWTTWAEFNIYVDPESARAIFSNEILASKIVLTPLDLTHKFTADNTTLNHILKSTLKDEKRPNVRILFYEILKYFMSTYWEVFGMPLPPVHDVLAVVVILNPSMVQHRAPESKYNIQVITDGLHGGSQDIRNSDSQCGRTVMYQRDPANPVGGVTVPQAFLKDEIWGLINNCLTLAEACVAVTDGNMKMRKN